MSSNGEFSGPVPRPIRVVIADDYPLLREGMRAALEADLDVEAVGECDVASVVQMVRALEPDVLLIGFSASPEPGLAVVRDLAGSGVKVVVFAADMSRDATIAALRGGVRGVLLKNAPAAQVLKCIRCVGRGELWASREIVSDLLTEVTKSAAPLSLDEQCARCRVDARCAVAAPHAPPPFQLTEREAQVLALIVAGGGNKQIAAQLGLQVHTVKRHLTNIFDKTGASNRLELAMLAVHHGMI